MMRTVLLAIVIAVLLGMSAVSFFRVIDAASEIDNLKSQISLQKKSLKFLRDISNQSLLPCTLTVEKLEAVATENEYPIRWEKQSVFIGSFEFVKNTDNCIIKIEQVAL